MDNNFSNKSNINYVFIEDSGLFQYNFFSIGAGPSIPYWDFHGSTFISSSYIRLTPDHQSKRGGLWNSVVGICLFDLVTCQERKYDL